MTFKIYSIKNNELISTITADRYSTGKRTYFIENNIKTTQGYNSQKTVAMFPIDKVYILIEE